MKGESSENPLPGQVGGSSAEHEPPPQTGGVRTDIDHDNPWPGLASFTERQSGLFFGRGEEAEHLFRLIRRDKVTVLHGQSGLGKTSLLQAGIFPRLRQHDFMPVLLRIDYSPGALVPSEQVKYALAQAIRDGNVDAPLPTAERSLWEYFHDPATEFWGPRIRLLMPVLVFDQFEELFTIGQADEESRRRGMMFVGELACLIENTPPPEVAARLDAAGAGSAGQAMDLTKAAGKVVLSMRSDFLAELESLQPLAHGVTRNRMRLRRMTGTQALEPGREAIEVVDALKGVSAARRVVEHNFVVNKAGELVLNLGDGYKLNPPVIIPLNATDITIGINGTISVLLPGQTARQEVGQLQLTQFINPESLQLQNASIRLHYLEQWRAELLRSVQRD